MPKESRLRVTIITADRSISAAVPPLMGTAFIAALAGQPTSIPVFLQALEPIHKGAASMIVHGLIARDHQELLWHQGLDSLPELDPLYDTWIMTDEHSVLLAEKPASGGLLWINLVERTLRSLPPALPIAIQGEVVIYDGHYFLGHTTKYDLTGKWRILS
jgi:hypothetical protein